MAGFPPRPDDGALGPPPPLFRIDRRRSWFERFGGWVRWLVLLALLILLFAAASVARGLYTNFLWFDSLGYDDVYTKKLYTQIALFFAGALGYVALLAPNLWLARRIASGGQPTDASAEGDPVVQTVRIVVVAVVLFAAVVFGATLAGQWDELLLWTEAKSFGVEDPQFHRDIGFYVFSLPMLDFIKNWLLAALVTVLLAIGLVYALAVRIIEPGRFEVPPRAKAHVAVVAALLLVAFALHHWLGMFHFVLRSEGAVFGVGWVDAHVRIPLQYALVALALVSAAAVLASIWMRGIVLPAAAIGVWVVMGVIGVNAAPPIVQRLYVEPNEIARERPYLERELDATRRAFALDRIDDLPFPAEPSVTEADIAEHDETIRDTRLWDHRPLRDTYSQLQGLRPLYDFADVDVDRYDLGGEERRQVMLSARELSQDRLPADARGWVNRHLQFTHGYGAVMSPVNEVTENGQPVLFLQDIPISVTVPEAALEIERPEIYFGEMTGAYAIVNTEEPEFDHPEGETNVYTTYEGESGVEIGSFIRRLAYAWEFADPNILISGAITDDSRLLYRRNVRERVAELAPFLGLDADPYLVVADGRLFWILDAYTLTDAYPYSRMQGEGYNYIRNSVKAMVDAYTGETRLYIADAEDPIVAAWADVFPDLFAPIDEMPDTLRAHVRYPEGMFRVQADMYRTYHIEDAQVLYNREDLWDIPTERFSDGDIPVQPYYVTMRLPGEAQPEFALIQPFIAANRQNAVALLVARSDGEHYGELMGLRLPTSRLVPGPLQVEARIDQDARVSEQLTLWNQVGSQVIRGNLLMIPIGDSYIYVEPIYLQAASLPFPELRRVVVVANGRVAMEPTLEGALDVIFGERAPSLPEVEEGEAGTPAPEQPQPEQPQPTGTAAPSPTAAPPAAPGELPDDIGELARIASEAYDRAQERLRQGDFSGYEMELEQVRAALERIIELTGGESGGSAP